MKYYARLAVTLYVLLFLSTMLWWKQGLLSLVYDALPSSPSFHGQNAIKARTFLKRYSADRIGLANMYSDYLQNRDPYLSYLLAGRVTSCEGRFTGYNNWFAKLDNVVIDPNYGRGRKGGENISEVMNQAESDEYYSLSFGFFRLPCRAEVSYTFGSESHLNNWLKKLEYKSEILERYEIPGFTIAVQRYEYVNMYHTMTDWFNTFLVTKVFKLSPENITILWIDGHPSGGLDSTWRHLFGKVVRIGEISRPIAFRSLIWGIVGYNSPLNEHGLPEVSYLVEFRQFFLSKHGIFPEDALNCKMLNILILWRRDYVAHPRNPSGSISRKIKNEDELLRKISDIFKGHHVRGLQIDTLPMREQLIITSKTDILIGMHGAGLSHTLFLPGHACLIEMFPDYYPAENIHFRAMAKWRHLYYTSWSNTDGNRELNNYYTVVDADEITRLADEMRNKICKNVE